MSKKPLTIILDFDGVIHSYPAWKGITPTDPPTRGARSAIAVLRRNGFLVKVLSTRCTEEAGVNGIKEWLHRYNIVVDGVIRQKEKAVLMVDDRGWRFDGSWERLVEFVQTSMNPWNRPDAQPQLTTTGTLPGESHVEDPRRAEVVRLQAEVARYRAAFQWMLDHGVPTMSRQAGVAKCNLREAESYVQIVRHHVEDALSGLAVGGGNPRTFREADAQEPGWEGEGAQVRPATRGGA